MLAVSATVLTWGLVSPLIKSASVPGEAMVFYRLSIGAIILLAALVATRRAPGRAAWRPGAIAGALFGANVLCFVFSVKLTTVANATLIGALQPAIVLLVASRWFDEVVRPVDIVCVLTAMIGVAIVIFGSSASADWNPLGDALAVAAVLTFTAYFLVTKRVRATQGTLEYMTLVHVMAALVVTPAVIGRPEGLVDLGLRDWAIVLFFALVSGTLGQMVIGWAQRYVDVSVSSLMLLGVPVIASLAAWAMLDEGLTAIQVSGGVVTLAAIGLMVYRRPAPRAIVAVAEPAATYSSTAP
jgi:drug/metabolite transporter (DMT)-like permease